MSQAPLVTKCIFKEKEFLVKMNIINGNTLYLCVTDKTTTEDWQCIYDAFYIENLTQKTGNYKQFDVFVTMLKSGLLKTSECVSLDLLSYEDLEQLRTQRSLRKTLSTPSHQLNLNSNRQYLILTYTVEFDRIHYPLPMEYCGPPNPEVLLATNRRLESEVTRLQEQLTQNQKLHRNESTTQITHLQRRIEELEDENKKLKLEVRFLSRAMTSKEPSKEVVRLQSTVKMLEASIVQEQSIYQRTVEHLKDEIHQLSLHTREMEKKLQQQLKVKKSSHSAVSAWDTENKPHKVKTKLTEQVQSRSMDHIRPAMASKIQNRSRSNSESSVGSGAARKMNTLHEPKPASRGRTHTRSSSVSSVGSNLSRKKGTRSRPSSNCSSASCNCKERADKSVTRRHKKARDLQPGMTDLEKRIQTLQKVLREGL